MIKNEKSYFIKNNIFNKLNLIKIIIKINNAKKFIKKFIIN